MIEMLYGSWKKSQKTFGTLVVLACLSTTQMRGDVYADVEDKPGSKRLRYRVTPGDELGAVLAHLGICPLWGKDSTVTKTLALATNQRVVSRNGDLIFPGEVIDLPVSKLAGISEVYRLLPGNIVEILSPKRVNNCRGFALATSRSQIGGRTPGGEVQTPPATSPANSPMVVAPIIPQSAPTANPTPVPDPDAAAEYALLRIQPRFSYSKVYSTDSAVGSSSVIASDLNYGAQLAWEIGWTETLRSSISLGFSKVQFNTTQTSKTLSHSSLLLSEGVLKAEKRIHPRIWVGAKVGASQAPFVRASSTNELRVDSLTVPEFGASGIWTLYQSKKLQLDWELAAKYLAPASQDTYQIQSGFGWGTQAWFTRYGSHHREFSGGLFYDYRAQNTSITQAHTAEVGASFRWSFEPFEEEETKKDP